MKEATNCQAKEKREPVSGIGSEMSRSLRPTWVLKTTCFSRFTTSRNPNSYPKGEIIFVSFIVLARPSPTHAHSTWLLLLLRVRRTSEATGLPPTDGLQSSPLLLASQGDALHPPSTRSSTMGPSSGSAFPQTQELPTYYPLPRPLLREAANGCVTSSPSCC